MKITQKQFDLFKEECEKWIKIFELSSFEFRFCWKEIDSRAEVNTDLLHKGVIIICFNKEIKDDINDEYIKRIAKHEMIHCLIGEFSEATWDRFAEKDNLIKLEEKIVNKLLLLIK